MCRLKIGRGPLLGKAVEFVQSQSGSGLKLRKSLLQAWTSAIEVDILSSGSLVTKRLDILVGGLDRGDFSTVLETASRLHNIVQCREWHARESTVKSPPHHCKWCATANLYHS